MKCPCYKCKDRYALCHNECESYKSWLDEKHKSEEWLKEQRYNAHAENIANLQRKGRYSFSYKRWNND